MCTVKHVLVLKNLYNWTKYESVTTSLSQKDTDSPVKEKFLGSAGSKEVHVDSLPEHEKNPSLLISTKSVLLTANSLG